MRQPEWNERATAATNARRELPRLMSAYFRDVRGALAAKPSPARLHKIRLASKKIRYTLELFAPCYGAAFEERMKALKDVQTSLGGVNDAVAARALLKEIMPAGPQRKNLAAYLKKRAAEKAEEFRVHWGEKFDAPGEERRWLAFLRKPHQARGLRKTSKSLNATRSGAATESTTGSAESQ